MSSFYFYVVFLSVFYAWWCTVFLKHKALAFASFAIFGLNVVYLSAANRNRKIWKFAEIFFPHTPTIRHEILFFLPHWLYVVVEKERTKPDESRKNQEWFSLLRFVLLCVSVFTRKASIIESNFVWKGTLDSFFRFRFHPQYNETIQLKQILIQQQSILPFISNLIKAMNGPLFIWIRRYRFVICPYDWINVIDRIKNRPNGLLVNYFTFSWCHKCIMWFTEGFSEH